MSSARLPRKITKFFLLFSEPTTPTIRSLHLNSNLEINVCPTGRQVLIFQEPITLGPGSLLGKRANNGASGKKEANRAGNRGEKGTFRCLFPSRSQLNSIKKKEDSWRETRKPYSPFVLFSTLFAAFSRFMHFDPSNMFQHFNLVPAPFSKGKSPRNEVVLYLLFYYC